MPLAGSLDGFREDRDDGGVQRLELVVPVADRLDLLPAVPTVQSRWNSSTTASVSESAATAESENGSGPAAAFDSLKSGTASVVEDAVVSLMDGVGGVTA